MSGGHLRQLPILLLLAGSCYAVVKNPITKSLNDGSVLHVSAALNSGNDAFIQQFTIAPNSKIIINVTDVSSSTSFIVAQVHVYLYNVKLSYDEDIPDMSSRTVVGTNIGLFVKPNSTITRLYLKNTQNKDVQGIAVAVAYDDTAPVPGGCNMEFDQEIAPYAKVQLQDSTVTVDAQPASIPFRDKPNCSKNPVAHEMYQMYLSERDFSAESYFNGIISMLTVNDIVANGYQVSYQKLNSPMRRIYSRYTGIGSVYATVATYGKKSAAYVPAFSYGCSPVQDPYSCEILTDVFPKFVCALCFFVGLIGFAIGHTNQTINRFIGILFVATMIGYMMAGGIGYGLLIGLCVAAMSCWLPFSSAVSIGWFFACIIMFSTLETLSIFHSNWIFLPAFILTVLLISVLIALTGDFITSHITGVIYSSFMIVLPFDYWFGFSLKYMLINPIRRATDKEFADAIILQPIQGIDIFLICVWVILASIRLLNGNRIITNYVPL